MIKLFKTYIKFFLELGVTESNSLEFIRRARVVNGILVSGISSSFPFILIFLILQNYVFVSLIAMHTLILCISILMSYKKMHTKAAFLSVMWSTTFILATGLVMIPNVGVGYLFFAVMNIPFIVFNNDEKKYTITACLYITLLAIAYPFIKTYIPGTEMIPDEAIIYVSTLCIITAATNLFSQSWYFQNSLYKSNSTVINQQKVMASQARTSEMGLISAGVAHEINNPLTIINGNASRIRRILAQNKFEDENLFKSIDKVIETTARIRKITDSLLLLSRDGMRDDFDCEDLIEIVTGVLDVFAEKFTYNKVDLISHFDKEDSYLLNCRKTQIAQVFMNLFSNSFDVIKDQDSPKIFLDIKREAKNLEIIISDSGPGVPEEIRENVMQAFYTTKPIGKGTGLGLSITSEIISAHGGNIKITEGGRGVTSFKIIIPMMSKDNNQEKVA